MRQRTSLLLALFLATAAHAAELEGIQLPDFVQVEGARLPRVGAGIRYRAMFKIYVATLHALPGKQRITLHPLGGISEKQIKLAFEDALRHQLGERELEVLRPRLKPLFDQLRDSRKGEQIALTAIKGQGLELQTAQQRTTIADERVAEVMLGIWIGARPVDPDLKRELLGR
jgi:hypothetical protein